MNLVVTVLFKSGQSLESAVDPKRLIKAEEGRAYTEEEVVKLLADGVENAITNINNALSDYIHNPTDANNKIICINDMVIVASEVAAITYNVETTPEEEETVNPEDIVTVELEDEE